MRTSKRHRRATPAVTGALIVLAACSAETGDRIWGEEHAVPTPPSAVPPRIDRDHPSRIIVDLEVVENVVRDRTGLDCTSWGFGGIAPGSVVRVRQGDRVVFNLKSHPGNRMPHKIEVRAVTGRGPGAASSFTAPGQTSRFRFEAATPGVFMYQSATAHMDSKTVNGMYGLILVEPREGLPHVHQESGKPEAVAGILQRLLRVGGFANTPTYSGRRVGGASASEAAMSATPVPAARSKVERISLGRRVYERACIACHQADGQGIPIAFPPLAGSDYLMADKKRSIEVVTSGLRGKITVNGKEYNGVMFAAALSDDEVANVMTFVRNNWGNEGDPVTQQDVRAVRDASFKR